VQDRLQADGGHGKRLIALTNQPRVGRTAITAIGKSKSSVVSIEALLGEQGEVFKRLLKESLQEVLEAARLRRGLGRTLTFRPQYGILPG
jgi:hypothetical protein